MNVPIEIREDYSSLQFAIDYNYIVSQPEFKQVYLSTYLDEMTTIGRRYEEGLEKVLSLCEEQDCRDYFMRLGEAFSSRE